MGSWFSKPQTSNTDNKGVVQSSTNNITIQESVEIHNDIIILLLFIITCIMIFQVTLKTCALYKNKMKKQYRSQFHLNNLVRRPQNANEEM